MKQLEVRVSDLEVQLSLVELVQCYNAAHCAEGKRQSQAASVDVGFAPPLQLAPHEWLAGSAANLEAGAQ